VDQKAILLKVRDSLWKRAVDREIERMVHTVFTRPLVVYPGGWGETLPKWLKTQITFDRMAQYMKGETGIATDSEALAYLYTASLVTPFKYDWVQIYIHLVNKVKGLPKDYFSKTDNPYIAGLKGLTEQQKRELERLKKWIWKQSQKRQKA